MSENENRDRTVSELANRIRENYASTGQARNSDLNQVLGNHNEVIEFKSAISSDPTWDLMSNYLPKD